MAKRQGPDDESCTGLDPYYWRSSFLGLKIESDPAAQTAALVWADLTDDRATARKVRAAVKRYRAKADG